MSPVFRLCGLVLLAFQPLGCDSGQAGRDVAPGVEDASTGSGSGGSTATQADASDDGVQTTSGESSGSDGGDSSSGGGDGGATPAVVDPNCIDGEYEEVLPDTAADIGDLVSAYDPSDFEGFVAGVLERRYGIGAYIVEQALMELEIGHCLQEFVDGAGSAQEIIDQLPLFVHECGHFLDLGQSPFGAITYVVTPELRFSCSQGATADAGGITFSMNRLNDDDWSALRPPCGGTSGPDCDGWADVYLDGDPGDAVFDGGDQGFDILLEELVQYVGSLATTYAVQAELGGSVHERDGSLTFLWYLTRYLYLARTEYPETYELLVNDECWRTAILTTWGRAWLYLDATEANEDLGEFDANIEPLALEPELTREIQLLRDAAGCG